MNQSIQFPDREVWDEAHQCIAFPVLVNGMQLTCALTSSVLKTRLGGEEPTQWLAAFREHRWDLEDEAQVLILDQQEDAQGWIWFS
ncbi:DUF1488 domain-containing protein [Klebsiella oxytoca]|uniref:DUF1488 domain-containing protein n=1 Tax=Klebsiella oxytoca TaxID=571 RepID=UPI001CCAE0E6|nr:DUF1488 domain-containing protein [Klebsiella oxytoca]MBZ7314355.1 DUF1488 domain-containing protein [Klebsiella oxytoca]